MEATVGRLSLKKHKSPPVRCPHLNYSTECRHSAKFVSARSHDIAWSIGLRRPPVQRIGHCGAERSEVVFVDKSAGARVQYFADSRRIRAPGDAECRNVQPDLSDQGERLGPAEGG